MMAMYSRGKRAETFYIDFLFRSMETLASRLT